MPPKNNTLRFHGDNIHDEDDVFVMSHQADEPTPFSSHAAFSKIKTNHPKDRPNIAMGEPYILNPNSYVRVQSVFHSL